MHTEIDNEEYYRWLSSKDDIIHQWEQITGSKSTSQTRAWEDRIDEILESLDDYDSLYSVEDIKNIANVVFIEETLLTDGV